ncbi:Trehalose-phosphatase [Cladobotryum mycophilum]|uniref:Trehalose-phosphatase n=1 Tax=Cladobotryum mycophilum TaxID=491253 RepID=A0ABR0S9W8_9HYPO
MPSRPGAVPGYPTPTESPENPAPRPVPERNDTLLPPHEQDAITRVPVTPGVALGTYDQRPNRGDSNHEPFTPGYFGSHHNTSSSTTPGYFNTPKHQLLRKISQLSLNETIAPDADKSVKLSGNIISATFTIPYALKYRHGSPWELNGRYHQSAHLDSLAYLSSKANPWRHTIVAWTGEIGNQDDDDQTSGVAPTSTSIALGDHAPAKDKTKTDEIFISNLDQLHLETQLYNDELRTIPVWLADDSDVTKQGIKLKNQSRWRRYAEHDLCALFHYRQHPPTNGRREDSRWADFCRMNEAFADKICETYKSGDVVMVHDYYLMLLPSILRRRRPDMYISFFLHAPFPTSELIRCLSRRKQVLEGPLGADLIAFQAYHYAQHFATCCTRILGLSADVDKVEAPGREVHVAIFPAGIDTRKITSLAWTKAIDEKCAALRSIHRGKKIIVGCDPLDSLGGVDKKLMAFGRFLERYPEWQEKVVLLQITSPTTIDDDDGEEAKYASQVNELLSSVNTMYGSLDYVPVQSYSQHLTEDEYFALLRCGDIALITSVRDGMSTTGLEYIVCQRDNHGPLMISEFSGTASSLEHAIQINPWDLTRVTDEIDKALRMSEEDREAMHGAIYDRVTRENVGFWVNGMLRYLIHALGKLHLSTHASRKPRTRGRHPPTEIIRDGPLIPSWTLIPIPHVSISAGGLLALADLTSIAERTAIKGGSSWLDAFVLAPGLHYQQAADALDRHSASALSAELGLTEAIELSAGEVRSYVINNVAMVKYLKRLWLSNPDIGVINLFVQLDGNDDGDDENNNMGNVSTTSLMKKRLSDLLSRRPLKRRVVHQDDLELDSLSHVLYLLSPLLTVAAIAFMVLLEEWWGLGFLIALMISRVFNIWAIKNRSKLPVAADLLPPRSTSSSAPLPKDRLRRRQIYKQANQQPQTEKTTAATTRPSEDSIAPLRPLSPQSAASAPLPYPHIPSLPRESSRLTEYTIDLSLNRRVVLKGLDTDLQAVTTQAWMRAKSTLEGYLEAASKLIVYMVACLSGNLSQAGAIVFMALLLVTAGLLGLSNAHARNLQMHGRRVGRLRVDKVRIAPFDPASAVEAGQLTIPPDGFSVQVVPVSSN